MRILTLIYVDAKAETDLGRIITYDGAAGGWIRANALIGRAYHLGVNAQNY